MRTLAALASVALIAACATHETVAPDAPKPVIAGGFGAAVESPELKAARDLAIAAIYNKFPTRALVETVASEVQVVAGLNYRFRIEMSGNPATRPLYEVVVYRDLHDHMSVTSVEPVAR